MIYAEYCLLKRFGKHIQYQGVKRKYYKKQNLYNLPVYFIIFCSILLKIVYCVFDKCHIAFLFAYCSERSYNFIHY